MNKGIIMSINKKWATVMTEDCQLVKTCLQPDMAVGKEILMDTTIRTRTAPVRNRSLKYAFLAASIVLVMAVGLLVGQGLFRNQVYAVVAVDVNPSLELSLNRELKVVSAKAMNNDAQQVLAGQDYEGLAWQEAVGQWTDALRQSNQYQIQNMLISAVMPEAAEQLRTELRSMEGTANEGVLSGIEVRVIYSNDQAVSKTAAQNGLSVGRQMLLNQAQVQSQNWDKTSIEEAPLGELIQTLLRDREQNQTRLTDQSGQTLSAQSEDPTSAGSTETNRETNQEQNQQTNQQSASGSDTAVSGTGTSGQQTIQNANQNVNQETDQNANGETTCISSGDSELDQQTSQSTLRETSRDTLQTCEESSDCSATCESSQIQQQQTSQIKETTGN